MQHDSLYAEYDSYAFLAPSQQFVTHLTKMTMFLLLLSNTDGNPHQVDVVYSPSFGVLGKDLQLEQRFETIGLRYRYTNKLINKMENRYVDASYSFHAPIINNSPHDSSNQWSWWKTSQITKQQHPVLGTLSEDNQDNTFTVCCRRVLPFPSVNSKIPV
jgi:hypothetical protein